jgi:glycosyltransferase involved in cell wall biosynthesis
VVIPLVSVIIPTFNRKDLLLRAVRSVVQQSYRPLEVVVVDDCSTDGTVEALAEQDFTIPVRILRLPINLGPAGARNKGILAAVGKYIAFLDSDDHWLPTKLERQVAAAERHAESESLVIYAQAEIRRRHETIVRPLRPICENEHVADYLFADGEYMTQCTVLVSAGAARKTMYRPEIRLHEDWDWYIRLQQHGIKFVMVPEVLCIVDDRAIEGRSSEARPDRSLSMLETWKPVISRKAYLAFRARIAPQMRKTAPLHAFAMILQAYLRGAISTWFLVVLTGRLVHPGLREFAYRLRQAFAGSRHSRASAHSGSLGP